LRPAVPTQEVGRPHPGDGLPYFRRKMRGIHDYDNPSKLKTPANRDNTLKLPEPA